MSVKLHSISPRNFSNFNLKLEKLGVETICHSALCINRPECFKLGSIAFLIMGNRCPRHCRYCAVMTAKPLRLDPTEPKKVAKAVKTLRLNYVVITSVTRDDLIDQGASHFSRVVQEVKKLNSDIKIEVLIPDFWGKSKLLSIIVNSRPDVINHNIECTRNRFRVVRPLGNYNVSLSTLKTIKELAPKTITKSGFMVGVGESFSDIKKTILDLKNSRVDIITIGQYLSPQKSKYPMTRIYKEKDWAKINKFAQSLNVFKKIFIGPSVRSSYHASDQYIN